MDAGDVGALISALLVMLAAVINLTHSFYRHRLGEGERRYLQLVTRQAELFNERFVDTQRLMQRVIEILMRRIR